MMRLVSLIITFSAVLICVASFASTQGAVRVKDLARVEGVRDNALVGYGIVVGLAGSGDSSRSLATLQSVKNTLESFGLILSTDDIKSKNAAAVIVTADLPAFAQPGDKLDVHVSSIGDARSLTGGTLYMTPLKGADNKVYALAQGNLAVGGFKLEANQSMLQRNHPTVGFIPQGGTVEREIKNQFVGEDGSLSLILKQPDFVTADRIVQALSRTTGFDVKAVHAGKVVVTPDEGLSAISAIATIQQAWVVPEVASKVVINERTGTLVSGADIHISGVVISHGSIELKIDTDFYTSQPNGVFIDSNEGIRTVVTPTSELAANQESEALYQNEKGTNIAELVSALKKLKLSTRDIISILQALKKSGALHAELVVQ
ncbi:flagellar basal body P-ring protein FlgI [Pseudoalteromonas sp. MMG022]|uniref:flagellar basal body P-ring protein FlgI n=1 Tax=Pseudoalteromonas sp. MMG022 TaxID=2909978 RepID=UPI001F297C1E|nr:flagellar basal body P-ring protein FlgI [Pseudoalteromonas sp. MMG022]MCF6436985.1 flagellar basal body P-ring protein FlgI [Pseudoalteromonas sp. MMG022]